MGANYGEYSSLQLDVLRGVAQGKPYKQIAVDLQRFKDGEPDESSMKGAIYESLDLRRSRGFRNRLDLIQDAYIRGQLTSEQLAPGYNTDAELSTEEKDLLGFINSSGHYSDQAIEQNYDGILGQLYEGKVKALRAQIGDKLFGRNVPFITSAVGYFVHTYDPHISFFKLKIKSHDEGEQLIQADAPILFDPEGAERGEALHRIKQQQEAAIIIDIISLQDIKDKNLYPRPQILAVGGEDLFELLCLLSERTDDETYKGFLHEAIRTISDNGTISSVPYVEKQLREGSWRLYMLGKPLDHIHREVLGAYEDSLQYEKDPRTMPKLRRTSS